MPVANTHHADNRPVHLALRSDAVPVEVNLRTYAGPESYCGAGVYEFLRGEKGEHRLRINAQNCIHCKSCDIKDPTQYIVWIAPHGGDGPKPWVDVAHVRTRDQNVSDNPRFAASRRDTASHRRAPRALRQPEIPRGFTPRYSRRLRNRNGKDHDVRCCDGHTGVALRATW
jgi:ferredoxin-like protein FixX